MLSMRRRFSVSLLAIGLFSPAFSGCGGNPEHGSAESPVVAPVHNPDPNSPLQGVGLENERDNLDKIKQATVPKR